MKYWIIRNLWVHGLLPKKKTKINGRGTLVILPHHPSNYCFRSKLLPNQNPLLLTFEKEIKIYDSQQLPKNYKRENEMTWRDSATKLKMAKKQLMVPATWGVRSSFHSLIALLVAFLVIASIYVTQNSGVLIEDATKSKSSDDLSSRCNLFSGKWVFDNKSYPLYKEKECTFMSDQLACEKFGRKDLNYQNWRWQPHRCDLPRYKSLHLSIISL